MNRLIVTFIFFCFLSTALEAQVWTQKASFVGNSRLNAATIADDNKAFLFGGRASQGGTVYKDLWEYFPSSDSWANRSDCPGTPRTGAVGFAIDSSFFFGLGWSGSATVTDFYEYFPSTDSWSTRAVFPGSETRNAAYGSCLGRGYVLGGASGSGSISSEFWEYDPINNGWTRITNNPLGNRSNAKSFTIDSLIYFGFGHDFSTNKMDVWSYNPMTNTWSQLPAFPGAARMSPLVVVADGKAIVGGGHQYGVGVILSDFYEYDPSTNQWTTLANNLIPRRSFPSYFSLNGSGYVFGGLNPSGGSYSDLWQVDYISTELESNTTSYNILRIFPNPASNNVSLTFNEQKELFFELRDLAGKLVLSGDINSGEMIDLSDLDQGVYVIVLNSSGKLMTDKVIISR